MACQTVTPQLGHAMPVTSFGLVMSCSINPTIAGSRTLLTFRIRSSGTFHQLRFGVGEMEQFSHQILRSFAFHMEGNSVTLRSREISPASIFPFEININGVSVGFTQYCTVALVNDGKAKPFVPNSTRNCHFGQTIFSKYLFLQAQGMEQYRQEIYAAVSS